MKGFFSTFNLDTHFDLLYANSNFVIFLFIPQNGNGGGSRRHRTRLCLVAQATKSPGDIVTSSCTPDARDSTCLAELTLPIHWWPEVNNNHNNFEDNSGSSSPPVKPTKIHIQVCPIK